MFIKLNACATGLRHWPAPLACATGLRHWPAPLAPVIVGELGLLAFDSGGEAVEHGELLKFFEFFDYYANANKVTHMLWDNGQHYDRRAYEWREPELYNIIKASTKSRSSTSESDLVYVKKGTPVRDAEVHLNLNGNVLTSIRAGANELVEGTDYEVNGEVLTIKAGYLSTLTASGELGEKAVLKAQFNKGADWSLHVLYYDTPVLQNAEGTTDDFAIPTAFNGDRLATMEAVYAAGGNAGPHNWTSLKEFKATYYPSYANNEIQFTKNFFNEVNDGVVILKFHFWSGAIIEYTITKNGTSITGTAS